MYTSTDFLDDVRTAARLSDTDVDWPDAKLFKIGSQELVTTVCSWLIDRKENHFVKLVEVLVTPGLSTYRISSLTMGAGLRDLKLVDGNSICEMKQVSIDSLNSACTGLPTEFAIQGNLIVFKQTPQKSYTLRQYINAKPGSFVVSNRFATVTAINGMDVTVTFGAGLNAAAVNGKRVSVIGGSSPYDYIVLDAPVTATGTTISFSSSLPNYLSVGDIVCLSGESIVPQIPEELVPMLVLATAARIFESLNYQIELKTVVGKLTAMKEELAPLFEDRIQGASESVESVL